MINSPTGREREGGKRSERREVGWGGCWVGEGVRAEWGGGRKVPYKGEGGRLLGRRELKRMRAGLGGRVGMKTSRSVESKGKRKKSDMVRYW